MKVVKDINYDELARSTDEFNGAQLKAVCVEAGMIALREGSPMLTHEHFLSGISEGKLYIFRPIAWLMVHRQSKARRKILLCILLRGFASVVVSLLSLLSFHRTVFIRSHFVKE